MYVRRLYLRNYRNYTEIDLEFKKGVNIIIGPNAQGKTNLLESIYFLSTGTSHRAGRDSELIKWSADSFTLKAVVFSHGRFHEVQIDYTGKKNITVDGVPLNRLSELLGITNVVLFSPDDLQLVKGSPGLRRRFMNICISRVSPLYRENLIEYDRILTQRNNLLRDDGWGRSGLSKRLQENLEVWDEQLIRIGSNMILKRAMVLSEMSEYAKEVHKAITSSRENLVISYEPSFEIKDFSKEGIASGFMKRLTAMRGVEIRRGVTMIGPHRDDLKISINDVNARVYGSQGQQRTSVLSLKLAELKYLKNESGEYPILLLDDVMSELDESRRNYLLNFIDGELQTFITTTDITGFKNCFNGSLAIFSFCEGKLQMEIL